METYVQTKIYSRDHDEVKPRQTPVHAEIIGSDKCRAEGYSARGPSPVLALCRKLVEAGFDPGRPLHAYRGEVLCLIVRSIGAGAALTVAEGRRDAPRFRRWKPMHSREGSPRIARQARATVRDRNRPSRALVGRVAP